MDGGTGEEIEAEVGRGQGEDGDRGVAVWGETAPRKKKILEISRGSQFGEAVIRTVEL